MIIHAIGISKTAASPTNNIPPTTQHIGAQKYYVFHCIYYYMYMYYRYICNNACHIY